MQSHSVLVWCGQGIYTPKPEGLHLVSRCLSQRVAGCFSFWSVKMNDRELLELAAKAVGIKLGGETDSGFAIEIEYKPYVATWNPLTDDGDALRLAAKLRLGIEFNEASVVASWVDDGYEPKEIYVYPDQTQDDDFNIVYTNHDKAARRAIVRAAAEIGLQMQNGGAA